MVGGQCRCDARATGRWLDKPNASRW